MSKIQQGTAYCSGMVLPFLVLSVVKLSSDLEFFKEVVCFSLCCGFGFVGLVFFFI